MWDRPLSNCKIIYINLNSNNQQEWETVKVFRVLDEMILIGSEKLSERFRDWMETDSDSLALDGTHPKEPSVTNDKDANSDDEFEENGHSIGM